MKIKKFFALLLAMTLCIGVFSVNAYAYVDESATAESQPVQEEAVPEETPEPEPTEEPMEALTPDGNLTIVDDNGGVTGAGKQQASAVLPAQARAFHQHSFPYRLPRSPSSSAPPRSFRTGRLTLRSRSALDLRSVPARSGRRLL